MKNTLLLVHDDEGQEARLQAALDITRLLGGHMSCIDVTAFPMIIGDAYGEGNAMLLADEEERERRNKARLETRLACEDVPWDWTDATGSLADCILDASMLADIIVLNLRLEESYAGIRDLASRVLSHARAPVLALPAGLERLKVARALIAWDGQTSAAATMRACVPLLRLATTVEIFMVRDGSEKVEAAAAAAYLSRHGIHAAVKIVDDRIHAADRHILAEATIFEADYVLMGAYSHGRLLETFGGVTKRMLAQARLPLILGH